MVLRKLYENQRCHFLVSSGESFTAKIEDFSIKNITEEKLLEVKFDDDHLTYLYGCTLTT